MPGYLTLFADRQTAGRALAERLASLKSEAPIVYALPRGGVPVAAEIAKALEAPLDLLLVRKIGAPGAPELALGAVVDGAEAQTVVNEDIRTLTAADEAYLERERRRELAEIERRRALYLKDQPRLNPRGRTVVVVDDGLATGATAKASIRALRGQGATRIVLAVPVAPVDTLAEMQREADEVVCLAPAKHFGGVGAFYEDFHQLTDEEMLTLLRQARGPGQAQTTNRQEVRLPPLDLAADLQIPQDPRGVVIFAHGSGSSRLSPRNRAVADHLNAHGMATLLLDLLTEEESFDRRNVFNIGLLADRLEEAAAWIGLHPELANLPLGLFGASTGAAAADEAVIELNRAALARLTCRKALELVPHAGHLFEEPGTLEEVMRLAAGWFDGALTPTAAASAAAPRAAEAATTFSQRISSVLEPLPAIEDPAFAAVLDRFAEARVVLLGEASHGTSEFYRARAAITRRLIERHGFNIVAVEADWPDAAAVDRYVRAKPHRAMAAPPFSRFPAWMWRNVEFSDFVHWMRSHNAGLSDERQAAFYGLDLYNLRGSMAAVLEYLDKVDPEAADVARRRYACLDPWAAEPSSYGMTALRRGYALCEGPVLSTLRDIVSKALDYAAKDGELFFDASQNARLVADAERYYRAMYFGAAESWNLRDRHMFETLEHILAVKGPSAKAVVWAHNSHIGDARFTDMGAERGELNIGQLCRERFGRQAALIGFGTHGGQVRAADEWDEPGRVMDIKPSRPDSYEALCHETGVPRFLLDLRPGHNEPVRVELRAPRLERYIGVIYRPSSELQSHYARSSLSEQFDGFVWFDETTAVTPLPALAASGAEDETYPFGL